MLYGSSFYSKVNSILALDEAEKVIWQLRLNKAIRIKRLRSAGKRIKNYLIGFR